MWSKQFWKDTAERAVKSGAQFALITILGGAVAGSIDTETAQAVNAFALDYVTIGGVFAGGALVSVLTSIGSGAITGTPSLARGKHEVERGA